MHLKRAIASTLILIGFIFIAVTYQNCTQPLPDAYDGPDGPGSLNTNFQWIKTGEFPSECDKSCGDAVKYEIIGCYDKNNDQVLDKYCDASSRPDADEMSCGLPACGSEPTWQIDSWDECSKECNGQQDAIYKCYDPSGVPIADNMCTGDIPTQSRECNESTTCPTYDWKEGGFGSCTATCGTQTLTQTVICHDLNQPGVSVDENNCSRPKPTTSKSCQKPACASEDESLRTLYRYYSSTKKDHAYAKDNKMARSGYALEGSAFKVYTKNSPARKPLYQCKSKDNKHHLLRVGGCDPLGWGVESTDFPASPILGYVHTAGKTPISNKSIYYCVHPTTGDTIMNPRPAECISAGFAVTELKGYLHKSNSGTNYVIPSQPAWKVAQYNYTHTITLGSNSSLKLNNNFAAKGYNYWNSNPFKSDASTQTITYKQTPSTYVALTYATSKRPSGTKRLFQCSSHEYKTDNRVHSKNNVLWTTNTSECTNGYTFPGTTSKFTLKVDNVTNQNLGYVFMHHNKLHGATNAIVRCKIKKDIATSADGYFLPRHKNIKAANIFASNICNDSKYEVDKIIGFTKP